MLGVVGMDGMRGNVGFRAARARHPPGSLTEIIFSVKYEFVQEKCFESTAVPSSSIIARIPHKVAREEGGGTSLEVF